MMDETGAERLTADSLPRIEVSRLTKTYRRAGGSTITPVDDVSLTVDPHELVVLLGPSGCGKTTLLRCVAGLERPNSGEIRIDGRLVFSSERNVFVPTDRRNLSMIFQSFALWPHMTVFANVAYPLQSRRVPRKEIRERVLSVLDMVGVGGLAEQHPGRISGGQQQRVALARALVGNTNVVLFDEPLSNVDAQVRAQLRFELKRMQRQIGFSGLYVTHDQTEAMELGHRVAVLNAGRIAALGPPREIYERPNSEYVASFIGTANIWPGTVTAADQDVISVRTDLGPMRVAASGAPAVSPGQEVSVIARPEKLGLARFRPEGDANAIAVRIEAGLFAGPHTEFVVTAAGQTTARIWLQDDGLVSDVAEGNEAWMIAPPETMRIVPRGKVG
jgi:ABC-type Fe3+/spermidine/putrescine transport system ATPase subunit